MSAKSINDFLIRMFVCVVFFLLFFSINTISSEKCHQYHINHTTIDNKLALSPVVFQGRLTSMSTPVNDLHFVSLRVLKVIKGKLSKRLRKQIRLQFSLGKRKKQFVNNNKECKDPPTFNPKSSRKKYIFFVQKIKPGNYVALAQPQIFNRKVRRNIRKILCNNCFKRPYVKAIISNSGHEIKESGQVKLKCILSQTGVPSSTISWTLNNRKLMPTIRHNIRTKKKRSILRIQGMLKSDSGEYKCKVHNIIGSSSASWQLTVKSSKASPSHQVSECPIESFCLNRGTCLFYEMIGELVCKCKEGYAGQRCQFKKAKISLPFDESKYKHSCGLYSHDYHLREICAVWRKSPDMKEMTYDEYLEWQRVERELKSLRKKKEQEKIHQFRQPGLKKKS